MLVVWWSSFFFFFKKLFFSFLSLSLTGVLMSHFKAFFGFARVLGAL